MLQPRRRPAASRSPRLARRPALPIPSPLPPAVQRFLAALPMWSPADWAHAAAHAEPACVVLCQVADRLSAADRRRVARDGRCWRRAPVGGIRAEEVAVAAGGMNGLGAVCAAVFALTEGHRCTAEELAALWRPWPVAPARWADA